jgi:hypothetical protein
VERLDHGETLFDRKLLLVGTGLGSDLPSLAEAVAPPLTRIPPINVVSLLLPNVFEVAFQPGPGDTKSLITATVDEGNIQFEF